MRPSRRGKNSAARRPAAPPSRIASKKCCTVRRARSGGGGCAEMRRRLQNRASRRAAEAWPPLPDDSDPRPAPCTPTSNAACSYARHVRSCVVHAIKAGRRLSGTASKTHLFQTQRPYCREKVITVVLFLITGLQLTS
jgi:hypothetical protein